VGTAEFDVSEVAIAVVIVRTIGVAGDAGAGVGLSPVSPKPGPCHSMARTNRTTSSTDMTARPTVLPDGQWSALVGCGRSLTSIRQYYPHATDPADGPFDPFTNDTWDEVRRSQLQTPVRYGRAMRAGRQPSQGGDP
jgi:hypothetical protein